VKWLLGEEEPANFNIEEEGIRPRATWRASPRIVRWGITWRQESPAVPASLGILGETPNVMVSTGFSVLKVDYANDSIWDDAVVALIAVHPVVEGDGEDDHIAVIMNAKLCHHACCAGANDKGMQFASGFAEEAEDVVFAFRDVNSQRMRVNRELKGKTTEKRPKRPRAKKADAAMGTQETDETVETEESSKKKGRRKAPESDATTSGASGEKTPKSRKAPKKLTLAEAILQANSLSSKSKPTEVEAMYKTLEEGLGACFPYGQDPIPHKISADRIHLAPDTMKYRTFIEKRKEQIQLEHTALGIIRKKPELYCVPLKREPGWKPDESGELLVKDEGVDLIMDRMPDIKELVEEDGKQIPWYESRNVHWYVVGGQHTYTACKQIGEKELVGSERYDFYMNHKIIPIYSKDEDMLIKVSNALNIQVKDKVVTENFRSQLANVRAKWIEKGRPHPAAGGGRHDSEFRVYIAALTFTVVFGPAFR
jgi:hypothetical protein